MTPDDKEPPGLWAEDNTPDTIVEDIMTIVLIASFSGILLAILLT